MTYLRSPQAEADLDGIWSYVATHSGSAGIADRFVDSIADRFLLLAAHPYLGRRRDDDLRRGIRSFPAGDYVILYRIRNRQVVILRVVHGNRDIRALL